MSACLCRQLVSKFLELLSDQISSRVLVVTKQPLLVVASQEGLQITKKVNVALILQINSFVMILILRKLKGSYAK